MAFEQVKKWWCSIAHGGGKIERDDHGRINWRCSQCGRWSDNPVSLPEEVRAVDREIEAFEQQPPYQVQSDPPREGDGKWVFPTSEKEACDE